jgi:hypothetical protein
MQLDPSEARLATHFLRAAYDAERQQISHLDQDSDEFIERANDLARLEAVIAKLADRPRAVR